MSKELSNNIVNKMLAEDKFSEWLGIQTVLIEQGHCILKMIVREEMTNGFGKAHGGIAFSFADSALAFASNSYGRMSVALECSISFAIPVNVNDELTCEARELSLTNKTGTYHIEVSNQKNEKVAFFKGTVYRTSKEWEITDTNNESKRIYEKGKDTKVTNNESKLIYETGVATNAESERINEKKDDKVGLLYPELSYKIVGVAFDVFNKIGGSHKEIVYQKALYQAFQESNTIVDQQVYNPVVFSDKTIAKNYFDFLIDKTIVVEIKSTDRFSKEHFDQLLNYLIVSKLKLGILVSFGRNEVKYKRVLNIDLINKEKFNK